MVEQPFDAIYENGVFRPLETLPGHFADRERISLRIEATPASTVLKLASDVYDGLSETEIQEIERIALGLF